MENRYKHNVKQWYKQTEKAWKEGGSLNTWWFLYHDFVSFALYFMRVCIVWISYKKYTYITLMIKTKAQRYKNKIIRPLRNWKKINHNGEKELRSLRIS